MQMSVQAENAKFHLLSICRELIREYKSGKLIFDEFAVCM